MSRTFTPIAPDRVKTTDRGAIRCGFVAKDGSECMLPINHDGEYFDHRVGPELRVVKRCFRRLREDDPLDLRVWLVRDGENSADNGPYVEDDPFEENGR